MEFTPITGKQLRCTSADKPKCETFFAPDVNASLGALELDRTYPVTARGGSVQVAGMTGTWYKILVENQEVYCLELPDGRCVVEDAPQQPETPAVDLTGVLAALAEIRAGQQAADAKMQAILDKFTAAGAALTE